MSVHFSKNFIKHLAKLPIKVQMQFYKRLELFQENKFDPILSNHSVDKAFSNSRSINITGDYRAIFRENGEVATFIDIGTHSELYG